MSAILSNAASGPGRRAAAEKALSRFVDAASILIDPPILQPVGAFLDMSGEDIRGRLFLTTDASGAELCLRPDFTIPVCLAHLSGGNPARFAQYAYLGPVFRASQRQQGEMVQTGLESYGRTDLEAADAEILAIALEAAERAGSAPLQVTMGDVRVFDGVIDALGLPVIWRRRVRRGLSQGKSLENILNGAAGAALPQSGVLAALERADHAGAKALVEDLLEIAGISAVGGRDVGEIADRFLRQASQREDEGVSDEQQGVLRRFLEVSGDPDSASRELRRLAEEARLAIDPHLDAFDERTGFIAARGLVVDQLRYSAAFVRDLEYYTGFVFEARDAGDLTARPAVVGGRYDGLARRLGASVDVPAVGAAIWIDRLPLRGVSKS